MLKNITQKQTVYDLDIRSLRRMFAEEMNVHVEAVSVELKTQQVGYGQAETTVFDGIKVTIDHAKNSELSSEADFR